MRGDVEEGRVIAVIAAGTLLDAAIAMLHGLRDAYPPTTLYMRPRSDGWAIVQVPAAGEQSSEEELA